MAQLYASKNPCNKCGSPISWDVTTRERLATKLPLNLDGSIHTREICADSKAVDPQSLLAVPEVATSTAQSRTEAIEKAHLENMESSERLRQSINALTERLGNIEKVLRLYLESKPN